MGKSEVVFVDNSKAVIKTLKDLSRTANTEVGKEIRKEMRKAIPPKMRLLKRNHVGTWNRIDPDTQGARLDYGLKSWQKVKFDDNKDPSRVSPYWAEKGIKPHLISLDGAPPRGSRRKKGTTILTNTRDYFGRTVSHPGQRAYNPVEKAGKNTQNLVKKKQEEFLGHLSKTLEEAQGYVNIGKEYESD